MAKSNRISPAQLKAMTGKRRESLLNGDWNTNEKIGKRELRKLMGKKPLRSKYGNVKTDGFDSKLERDHHHRLLLREKAGDIHGLERQKVFVLQEKFRTKDGEAIRAIAYKADFYYLDKNDQEYVDDAKGFMAQHSAIKVKMFKFRYRNIKFTLIKK